MKSIEQIAFEFAKKITESRVHNNAIGIFKTYIAVSGYYKGSYYFDVYFTERNEKIRIADVTENAENIIKIIKIIEPKAKVTYTKITKEEITV